MHLLTRHLFCAACLHSRRGDTQTYLSPLTYSSSFGGTLRHSQTTKPAERHNLVCPTSTLISPHSLACLKHQGGILVRCWATLAGPCQCWGVAALFRFKELIFLLYLTLSIKEPSTKLISAFGFCSLILSATAEMQSSLFPTTDLFNLLSHPTSLVKRPWNI